MQAPLRIFMQMQCRGQLLTLLAVINLRLNLTQIESAFDMAFTVCSHWNGQLDVPRRNQRIEWMHWIVDIYTHKSESANDAQYAATAGRCEKLMTTDNWMNETCCLIWTFASARAQPHVIFGEQRFQSVPTMQPVMREPRTDNHNRTLLRSVQKCVMELGAFPRTHSPTSTRISISPNDCRPRFARANRISQ